MAGIISLSATATPPVNHYMLSILHDPSRIMHFNGKIHSPDGNCVKTLTTIPLFVSQLKADRFKSEILEKKRLEPNWFISKDHNSSECVIYTRVVDEYKSKFAQVISSDLDDDTHTPKLMMNGISVFYVEDYWIKSHLEQLIIVGSLWTPPVCMSGEIGDPEFIKEAYEKMFRM